MAAPTQALASQNTTAIELFSAIKTLKSSGENRVHRIRNLSKDERNIVDLAIKWRQGHDKDENFQAQLDKSPTLVRGVISKLHTKASIGRRFLNLFSSMINAIQSCFGSKRIPSESMDRKVRSFDPYGNGYLQSYQVDGTQVNGLQRDLNETKGVYHAIQTLESLAKKANGAHDNPMVCIREAYSEPEIDTIDGGYQFETGRYIEHEAEYEERPPEYYSPSIMQQVAIVQNYATKIPASSELRTQLDTLATQYQAFAGTVKERESSIPQSTQAKESLESRNSDLHAQHKSAVSQRTQARNAQIQALIDSEETPRMDLLRAQLDLLTATPREK